MTDRQQRKKKLAAKGEMTTLQIRSLQWASRKLCQQDLVSLLDGNALTRELVVWRESCRVCGFSRQTFGISFLVTLV